MATYHHCSSWKWHIIMKEGRLRETQCYLQCAEHLNNLLFSVKKLVVMTPDGFLVWIALQFDLFGCTIWVYWWMTRNLSAIWEWTIWTPVEIWSCWRGFDVTKRVHVRWGSAFIKDDLVYYCRLREFAKRYKQSVQFSRWKQQARSQTIFASNCGRSTTDNAPNGALCSSSSSMGFSLDQYPSNNATRVSLFLSIFQRHWHVR